MIIQQRKRNILFRFKALKIVFVFGLLSLGSDSIQAAETETVEMTDVVVTASRSEEDSATVSSSITVIDAEDIATSGALSVVDLLKDVPGLSVADWAGVGRTASVDIRGFGETGSRNTLVVIDGRRVNPPDMSEIDWTIIPLDQIERIEIIRGGGSVLYGSNASGGVINIITKKGEPENTVTNATTFGSYDFLHHTIGVAGSTDKLTYNLQANYINTDGYRDNSEFLNKSAGLNLGYTEDTWAIDLSAGMKSDDYGLPGAISPTESRRQTASTPDDYAKSRDRYLQVIPRVMLSGHSELSLALNTRKLTNKGEMSGWSTEQVLYDHGISPQYNAVFETYGIQHNMIVGADYIHSKIEDDFRDDTLEEYGAYFHDKIRFADDFYFNFGYRLARVKYDLDNGLSDSSTIHLATGGLTYNYAPFSKAFVSLERGYRAAALDELGGYSFDEILDPQISMHYQTGIQHRINPYTELGATVFQIDIKDEILFNPALPSFFGGQNDNYGRTRRRGVELDMAISPHDMIRISGNYTYIKSELRGGAFDGNDIPGVADHITTAGMTFFPFSGLSIDTRIRWIYGKSLISDWENEIGDDWEGGDYIVVDTKLSYTQKLFIVNLGVKNLFNEKYSEYGTYSDNDINIYPSPERNYFGEVRIAHKF